MATQSDLDLDQTVEPDILNEFARRRRDQLVHAAEVERRAARRRDLMRRRAEARARRNRLFVGLGLLTVAVCSFLVFGGGAGAKESPKITTHFVRSHVLAGSYVIPGKAPTIKWPTSGQGAIAVLGEGLMASSRESRESPIASLTKMMTAYLVLRDHPLTVRSEGPSFTMTATDVANWVRASQSDESNAPVQLGEVLTEHQLLEALLLPSADNIADLLATWDAGSIRAFVAKMNAEARVLGLRSTHYADASGVNPGSESTASDQAVLASTLMENPVVRTIVSHPSLTFPVAGTIRNYNPALGVDGIIGVKSGFTSMAKGCLATAAWRIIDGKSVLVVSVTLGQPGGLYGAASVDERLLAQASRSLVAYAPVPAGAPLGTVVSASGEESVALGSSVPVVVGFPGLRVSSVFTPAPASGTASRSTSTPSTPSNVGELSLTTSYGTVATAPVVRLTSPLA